MPFIMRSPDRAGSALHLSYPLEPETRSGTVFVIDQDAAVRDALSVTLRASGFDVLAYRTAGDFFRRLPIRGKACLLIEFDLADMTGMELMARLAASCIHLPAVVMSARLRMPDFERPRPAGVVALLQKPFGQDELLKGLDRAFDHLTEIRKTT